jgi:hypothetical protein
MRNADFKATEIIYLLHSLILGAYELLPVTHY